MNLNADLTPREEEIARLLAWGAAKKQIAYKLRISVNTVKNISQSLYDKTGVQSVGQIASWWFVVKHGVSIAARPLLALLFLSLVALNEFNDDDQKMIRTKTAKVKTMRAGRGRKRFDDDDTFQMI